MSEIILDSVIDSIKLLPFLFLTYLFMEWLEHKTGVAARKRTVQPENSDRYGVDFWE